jgi:hypothetical protein
METLARYLLRCVIYVAGIIVPFASSSYGGVFISDQVTTLSTDVYLKVQTRGRFFSEGGKLVDIFVDDKKIKRILTGGDGYGYQRYTPERTGMGPWRRVQKAIETLEFYSSSTETTKSF